MILRRPNRLSRSPSLAPGVWGRAFSLSFGLACWVLAASASDAERPSPSPDRFAAVPLIAGPAVAAPADTAEAGIAAAARRGARYVVVPGVPLAADPAGRIPIPEPVPGPSTHRFGRLAADLGIWLALTVAERTEGGFFLTTVLLDDRGSLAARHRAVSLSADWRAAGAVGATSRTVLDTVDDGRRRLGILSGDDLAVGVARLAHRGAEQILVTASWTLEEAQSQRALCRELARRYRVDLVVAAPLRAGATDFFSTRAAAPARHGRTAFFDLAPRTPRIPSALGLPSVPLPADQDLSPAIVELGRTLFFDRGLSSTGQVACASCHQPGHGFSNGLPRGVGVHGRTTLRNVPSLLNVAFKPVLQWDAGADRLEEQAKLPISGANEMNFHFRSSAVPYLRSRPDYVAAFRQAMGVEEIRFPDAGRALAAFQRTLIAGDSPFDRYQYGKQPQALDEASRSGLAIFLGRGRCAACHTVGERYALFSDFQPHSLGVGYTPEQGYRDLGAFRDGGPSRSGFFVTPSLRNVALTAPYMHDGSLATLEEVVELYDRGGIESPNRDPFLLPLGLTAAEKNDLVAFLRSLTGRNAAPPGKKEGAQR